MTDTSTLDFLQALYPTACESDALPGELVVWTLPDKASRWCASIEDAARLAVELRDSRDVYYGVARQDRARAIEIAGRKRSTPPAPRNVRGYEASAVTIPGVWLDLDVAGPGHRGASLPPDRQTALALLAALPVEPTIIVRSGGGFHVYWLFHEPWILGSATERAAARRLVEKVQLAVRRRAAERSWRVDATADLTRVLRLPGTLNHKGASEPRPVTVEVFRPEARCDPCDFDPLPEPPAAVAPRSGARQPGPPDAPPRRRLPVLDGEPVDFDDVRAGCSFFRFCDQHQADVPEPWWYAVLSLAGRCASHDADGYQLAHRMSRRYPRYSPAETDAKLWRALTEAGPRTCRNIGWELGAWNDHCADCPNRGKVRSPLELGRRSPPNPLSQPPLTPSRERGRSEPESESLQSQSSELEISIGRDPILITHREDLVCDQAIEALAAGEPNLFRRGGLLVQVVPAEDTGDAGELLHRPPRGPRIVEVPEPRLRELLARHCAFVVRKATRGGGSELKPAHPPAWAVREILSRPSWPRVRRIEGIVEGPVLRPDGSVLQHPGYDAASGLYCAPAVDFERVPEAPTRDQAEDALAVLTEAVCDFPFGGEAHFSAWLASLLTPLARYAFRGPSPLYVIDANVRGAGKSLLADVCHLIVTGRPAPRTPYTRDESELRKAITAIALAGSQMVLIDNVTGVLGSSTLDLVLTAATWSDRLLGANTRLELPLSATWYVTGNNLVLGEDTPRRSVHIRLESPEEKPEERTEFRHPDLLGWIERRRQRLLPAALTLLAAYQAAGRPAPELIPMGSYEGWSSLVRATLVWLGLPDPAITREALPTTADAELATLESLVVGLEEVLAGLGGVATAKEILRELGGDAFPFRFEILRGAIDELFPRLKQDELPTPKQLGIKLRKFHGRVVAGAAVVQAPRSPKGAQWTVRRTAEKAAA